MKPQRILKLSITILLTLVLSKDLLYADSQKTSFKIIDIRRSISRDGKRLSAPREIYLVANRYPTDKETAHPARSPEHAWRGKRLTVFRTAPIDQITLNSYQPPATQVVRTEPLASLKQELTPLSEVEQGALSIPSPTLKVSQPLKLTQPNLPEDILEAEEDDDAADGSDDCWQSTMEKKLPYMHDRLMLRENVCMCVCM